MEGGALAGITIAVVAVVSIVAINVVSLCL
jgi:hypothetical protein